VRLVPVIAHAHVNQQRHIQLAAALISGLNLLATCSTRSSRTSSTNSSCTCKDDLGIQARFAQPVIHRTMARLMISAAVPCIGALIAVRSAPLRNAWFFELISGKYRRRPNSVST
jgi:hypothetical protein